MRYLMLPDLEFADEVTYEFVAPSGAAFTGEFLKRVGHFLIVAESFGHKEETSVGTVLRYVVGVLCIISELLCGNVAFGIGCQHRRERES